MPIGTLASRQVPYSDIEAALVMILPVDFDLGSLLRASRLEDPHLAL